MKKFNVEKYREEEKKKNQDFAKNWKKKHKK
jgi:hypothetical protein